jgi:hypothetical protein
LDTAGAVAVVGARRVETVGEVLPRITWLGVPGNNKVFTIEEVSRSRRKDSHTQMPDSREGQTRGSHITQYIVYGIGFME